MIENNTRNQHYLPRVEQKLNALNPNARDKNLRIYSFKVLDRDRYTLQLESENGRSIDSNLSMLDLFSFDVAINGQLRKNFENLFARYEAKVGEYTCSLLRKLRAGDNDLNAEVINLFAAKFLNVVRNPYSIAKILNTFPFLASYEPTNPILAADYGKIIDGRKPHQTTLCLQLGIDDAQYIQWLRTLFMLLTPLDLPGQPNLFEVVIKQLFEGRKSKCSVFVWDYDHDRCLLCDRGYCQPIPDGQHLGFSFNLCSGAFVDYAFIDVEALMRDRFSPAMLAGCMALVEQDAINSIDVSFIRNDQSILSRYNRHVIEYCRERVYCSTKEKIIAS